MAKVLMVKGNTETYVDELDVEEMEEKGFEVVDITPKAEVKPEDVSEVKPEVKKGK